MEVGVLIWSRVEGCVGNDAVVGVPKPRLLYSSGPPDGG